MTTFLHLVKAESGLEEVQFLNPLPVASFSEKWDSNPNICLLEASEPLAAELQWAVRSIRDVNGWQFLHSNYYLKDKLLQRAAAFSVSVHTIATHL